MRKPLQNNALWLKVMRISIIQAIVVVMFTGVTYAVSTKAQVLDKLVSLRVENQEVTAALQKLEKQTSIKFVFSPQVIKSGQRITANYENERLGVLLEKLLSPLHIKYEVSGKYILLSDKNPQSSTRSLPRAEQQEVTPDPNLILVKGKVKDEKGEGLPGVSVLIKGTQQGTITDVNGNFELEVTDQATTLVFSFVGYKPQEIPVGDRAIFNLSLEPSDQALNEVVVIGYGTSRKKDVVGSVDIVNAKDAGSTTATNPSQLLIGKSAGVQVLQSNGTPGSDSQILIRGTGSFTGVDPLYVIDGIQGSKTMFNTLGTQDIENITILKDASSTAIYGSAAANGVVIITTRKGRSGTPKINFNSQWGRCQCMEKT